MMTRLACLSIALLLVLFAPPGAAAQDAPKDPHTEALRRRLEALQQQEAAEEALRAQWQQRERERIDAIDAARAHLAETEENRALARDGAHDGVKRSEWTRRARSAREALAEAELQLEEMHEQARQADVPPGWFETD